MSYFRLKLQASGPSSGTRRSVYITSSLTPNQMCGATEWRYGRLCHSVLSHTRYTAVLHIGCINLHVVYFYTNELYVVVKAGSWSTKHVKIIIIINHQDGTMVACSSSVWVIACSSPSHIPPLLMHVGKWLAVLPAAKRLAHVATEVDLRKCTLHSPPQKSE